MFTIFIKTRGPMSCYEALSPEFWDSYGYLKSGTCIPPELEHTRRNPLAVCVIETMGRSASVDGATVEVVEIPGEFRIFEDDRGCEHVEILRGGVWTLYL
jgi:hypothetical protein